MKKILFLLILLPLLAPAQVHRMPQYPEVLRAFFLNYSYEGGSNYTDVRFAKKENAWYVNVEDLQTEKIIKEQLFWPGTNGMFKKLEGFEKPVKDPELEILRRLTGWPAFYGYSRSSFYGYPGWNHDVIRMYGKKDLQSLNDTLLDGLARAYSAYADQFLWHQYGGAQIQNDTLKTQLRPGLKPSAKRLDSVRFYLDRAIEAFSVLAKKFPDYQTLVGNSVLKKNNEEIHAYLQMQLSGEMGLASGYLKRSEPDPRYAQIARNYLAGLPANSILFTGGDNDTYPLWHLQEKENFRKDVTVINANLLGFIPFVHHLDKNHSVKLSVPASAYLDSSFLYALKNEGNPSQEGQTIKDFIKHISVQVSDEKDVPFYQSGWLKLDVDVAVMEKMSAQKKLGSQLIIPLNNYITMDQLMILDIVDQNIHTRPLYFSFESDLFTNYLQKEGLVYRLLPLNPEEEEQNLSYSITKIESFLNQHFHPLLPNQAGGVTNPASNTLYETISLYHDLVLYYHDRGETTSAENWFAKMKKVFADGIPFTLMNNKLGKIYALMGEKQQAVKLVNDWADKILANYRQPDALEPILAKEHLLDYLTTTRNWMIDLKLPDEKLVQIIKQLEK